MKGFCDGKVFVLLLLSLLCVIPHNGVEASHKTYPTYQSVASFEVKEIHRTAYHFQPLSHWINGKFLHYTIIFFFSFGHSFILFVKCCFLSFLLFSASLFDHHSARRKEVSHVLLFCKLNVLVAFDHL